MNIPFKLILVQLRSASPFSEATAPVTPTPPATKLFEMLELVMVAKEIPNPRLAKASSQFASRKFTLLIEMPLPEVLSMRIRFSQTDA